MDATLPLVSSHLHFLCLISPWESDFDISAFCRFLTSNPLLTLPIILPSSIMDEPPQKRFKVSSSIQSQDRADNISIPLTPNKSVTLVSMLGVIRD